MRYAAQNYQYEVQTISKLYKIQKYINADTRGVGPTISIQTHIQ